MAEQGEAAIREWEFAWRGMAAGARVASAGYVREYGRSEEEARARVLATYPAITSLSGGEVIDDD